MTLSTYPWLLHFLRQRAISLQNCEFSGALNSCLGQTGYLGAMEPMATNASSIIEPMSITFS
jgi:hypothetical protein